MRKYIIIAVLFISLLVDFIFFDYDISDIRHKREDTTEMVDKLTNSMTMDFPIYFQKLGFHIKNCKDYYKYKPEAIDAFEKENLRDLEKKCDLIKILLYAKVSKNSFLDTILLTDYKTWSSDIYFNYTCDKIDLEKYKETLEKNKSVYDLIKNNLVKIQVISQKELIVYNNVINKKFHVKEIFRANFDDDENRDVLVQISQSDPTENFIECNKYVVFSRNDQKELLKEKKIKFRKKIKNVF